MRVDITTDIVITVTKIIVNLTLNPETGIGYQENLIGDTTNAVHILTL